MKRTKLSKKDVEEARRRLRYMSPENIVKDFADKGFGAKWDSETQF